MIHPLAYVEQCEVGLGTKIWQFAVVLSGARIGEDCNVNAHTLIEGDVVLGNRVTVKSGVYIWNVSRIGEGGFLGPNVTFTNDLYPRSKKRSTRLIGPTIQRNVSVGANVTILPGVTLGENCMVGAGSVVTRSVPAGALVFGAPATIQAYLCECGSRLVGGSCGTCGLPASNGPQEQSWDSSS